MAEKKTLEKIVGAGVVSAAMAEVTSKMGPLEQAKENFTSRLPQMPETMKFTTRSGTTFTAGSPKA